MSLINIWRSPALLPTFYVITRHGRCLEHIVLQHKNPEHKNSSGRVIPNEKTGNCSPPCPQKPVIPVIPIIPMEKISNCSPHIPQKQVLSVIPVIPEEKTSNCYPPSPQKSPETSNSSISSNSNEKNK